MCCAGCVRVTITLYGRDVARQIMWDAAAGVKQIDAYWSAKISGGKSTQCSQTTVRPDVASGSAHCAQPALAGLFLLVAALVVLLLRRVDVHRIYGALGLLSFRPVLRFALRQLRRNLGVGGVRSLGAYVLAGHDASFFPARSCSSRA